jgi:hypothetical protein
MVHGVSKIFFDENLSLISIAILEIVYLTVEPESEEAGDLTENKGLKL